MGVAFYKIQKQLKEGCKLIELIWILILSWGRQRWWGNELLLIVGCFLRLLWRLLFELWGLGLILFLGFFVFYVNIMNSQDQYILIHINFSGVKNTLLHPAVQNSKPSLFCGTKLLSLISIFFPFSHVNVTMQGCYVMGETLTILTLRHVTILESFCQSQITMSLSWPIRERYSGNVKVAISSHVVWLVNVIIKTSRLSVLQYQENP